MKKYTKIVMSFAMALVLLMNFLLSDFGYIFSRANEKMERYVYFGNYIQEAVTDEKEIEVLKTYKFKDNKEVIDGIHYAYKNRSYYKDAPIQWRILKDYGDSYLLMSEKILENRALSSDLIECWEDADLRTWLNTKFIDQAFGEDQSALIETTITSRDVDWNKINLAGSTNDFTLVDTKDKVWLLDEDEILDSGYGFDDVYSRIAYASPYVDEKENAQMWFLRGHPYFYYGLAHMKVVETSGEIHVQGGLRDHENAATWVHGIRPVIRVEKGAAGLSDVKPDSKAVNTIFTDSSLELTQEISKLFSGNSSLGKFTLNGPEISIGGKSFNIFKFDGEVSSPFLFDNTDFIVKHNAEDNTVEVLVGYDNKKKRELDQASRKTPKWEDAWKRTRSMVIGSGNKKFELTYDSTESILDRFNAAKKELKKRKVKAIFSAEVKIVGYFKLQMNELGEITRLSEGGIIIDGNIGVKAKHYLWTIVYVQGAISGELNAKVSGGLVQGKIKPSAEIELAVKPDIALGANAIVADIQGGVEGRISGKITLPWKNARESVLCMMSGKVYAKINTMIGVEGECSYSFPDYLELYPEMKIKKEKVKLRYTLAEEITKKEKKVLSAISDNKIDDTIIDSLAYAYAKPQTIKLSDGSVLLTYLSDSQKEADGQTTLMYRINKSGEWSDAKALHQTNRMDTMAKLFQYDGKCYAVYQNSSQKLQEDLLGQQVASSMEIYIAEFDEIAGKFNVPIKVSSENDTYKYNFFLCEKNGKLAVMWAENSEKDVLLQSGSTKIYEAFLEDGKWTEGQMIQTFDYVINEMAYGIYGGKEMFAYVDATEHDLHIGGINYVGDEALTDIKFINDKIYYILSYDSQLRYIDPATGYTVNTGICVGNNYFIDENKGVYWTESDGLKNNIFYQSFEEGSSPVQITYEDGFIGGFVLCETAGGSNLVYTVQTVDTKNESPYGKTIMKSTSEFHYNKLIINSVSYDVLTFKPGKENILTIDISNTGTNCISNIQVTVRDEDGIELAQGILSDKMEPGENAEKDISVNIPDSLTEGELDIELTSDEKLEERAVFKKKIEVADADIVLEKLDELNIKVANKSEKLAENVIVEVYDTMEMGRLLNTYKIGNIKLGESKTINIETMYEEATKHKEDYVMLYCKATQKGTEYILDDNIVILSKKYNDKNIDDPFTSTSINKSETGEKKNTVGKSNYDDRKTTVIPKIPKVSGVNLRNIKGKKLRISWKWQTGISGFQLQYALNKKFTKNRKSKNVGKWISQKTVKGLKKKKVYYVRVRAYKKHNGKKIYGGWSKIKKKKIKK